MKSIRLNWQDFFKEKIKSFLDTSINMGVVPGDMYVVTDTCDSTGEWVFKLNIRADYFKVTLKYVYTSV